MFRVNIVRLSTAYIDMHMSSALLCWSFHALLCVARTLSYWCFSPGYAMSELTEQGVRSVILTSGTLSPLDSFSYELHM